MFSRLSVCIFLLLLHFAVSLNLNPLTPFHKAEKEKSDLAKKKKETDQLEEVKSTANKDTDTKVDVGTKKEVKSKTVVKSKKGGNEKEDASAGHTKVDNKANVEPATEAGNHVTPKKKVVMPSLFTQVEADNTPAVQREAHVVSHKSCQSKEDKGCCEGFIDLVVIYL